MNFAYRKIAFVALAFLTSGPAGYLAAAVTSRTYVSGAFELTVDGVTYANVLAWKGGELVADIVNENSSAGGVLKKHVANVHVAPLRVEFAPGDSAGLLALMNEVLTDKAATHTVMLKSLDFSGKVVDATEFLGSSVAGLELSAYDGSSKISTKLTLVFQPLQVRKAQTVTAASQTSPKSKATLASNFRFDLDGLPGNRVGSVSALTVTRAAAADSIGIARDPGAAPGQVGFANLVLSIANADLAAWQAWADSFLVQGHHLDSDEKKGALTQLEANMTAAVFTIQLSHVGLVRLSQSGKVNNDSLDHFEVELYYEGATVAAGSTSTATATASTPADQPTSTPPTTDTTAATDTAAPATTEPTTTTAADTTATSPGSADTGPKGDPGTAAASNPPLLTGNLTKLNKDYQPVTLNPTRQAGMPAVATAQSTVNPSITPVTPMGAKGAAGGTATDPSDQGVRDPREFLRISGLVRKSYNSVDFEATSEETVMYVSTLAIDQVLAKYEEALKGASWEEVRKDESGSAADFSHFYHLKWTKTVQEADLRFLQTKTGGTELTIAIYTRRAGILSGLAAALKGAGADLAATEGSPNDLGARDPTEFPRIGRSTRKSFSSSGSAKAPEENAVYRAKLAIASVEAFYVNQLNQADWEQSARRENGDPLGATHEITLNWSRGKRSVKIYLKEIEPAITEITLSLSTSNG